MPDFCKLFGDVIQYRQIFNHILSRYGVHGFPTHFLLNSTIRVRYHGSRTLNSLVAFYYDVTENCPFSWARSPEKLLRHETYLTLATEFVIIRLLYFLLPSLLACASAPCKSRSSLHERAIHARTWACKSFAHVPLVMLHVGLCVCRK
ncbi:hypothetical protein MKX01_016998 [Papaver californicum]|nr:hypothetical protein MKX01_016998 [Papaver californicum]